MLSELERPAVQDRQSQPSLDGYKTLVLNADASILKVLPLSVVPWNDAVTGIMKGRYMALEHYPKRLVRSEKIALDLPSVVMMCEYQMIEPNIGFSHWHVMIRDEYTCQYCGKRFKGVDLTLDHVNPRCNGGTTRWDNITAACYKCNSAKGHRILGKDWKSPLGLSRPLNEPVKPTYWDIAKKVKKTPIIIPADSGWLPFLDWTGQVYERANDGKLRQVHGEAEAIADGELLGF